jgi:hypothetical protein
MSNQEIVWDHLQCPARIEVFRTKFGNFRASITNAIDMEDPYSYIVQIFKDEDAQYFEANAVNADVAKSIAENYMRRML